MAEKPPSSHLRYFCGCAGFGVPLVGALFFGIVPAGVDSNDCADFTKDCGFSFNSSFTCGLVFKYDCSAGWFSRYSWFVAKAGFFESSPEMLLCPSRNSWKLKSSPLVLSRSPRKPAS